MGRASRPSAYTFLSGRRLVRQHISNALGIHFFEPATVMLQTHYIHGRMAHVTNAGNSCCSTGSDHGSVGMSAAHLNELCVFDFIKIDKLDAHLVRKQPEPPGPHHASKKRQRWSHHRTKNNASAFALARLEEAFDFQPSASHREIDNTATGTTQMLTTNPPGSASIRADFLFLKRHQIDRRKFDAFLVHDGLFDPGNPIHQCKSSRTENSIHPMLHHHYKR